jgi:hypothetical protein
MLLRGLALWASAVWFESNDRIKRVDPLSLRRQRYSLQGVNPLDPVSFLSLNTTIQHLPGMLSSKACRQTEKQPKKTGQPVPRLKIKPAAISR